MRKIKFIVLIMSFLSLHMVAQSKKEKDHKAIKSMCGCYEVGFNFAETFSYAKDTTYQPSAEKHANALEWVELVTDSDDALVLQHLLIARDTMIIKHWRQDWLYEHTDLYQYHADNHWKYTDLKTSAVQGQWTQKVFQVDDSPRYEGTATWVHVDGKSFWENRTDAPLPRREYTKRNDYNVTVRGNRHEITETGWIHVQLNDKVIRKSGVADQLLAQEVGLNTYTKVADEKCKVAQDWWAKNHKKWDIVRDAWDSIFAKRQDVTLHHKVTDKRLYEYLFPLEDTVEKDKIVEIITSFVKQ